MKHLRLYEEWWERTDPAEDNITQEEKDVFNDLDSINTGVHYPLEWNDITKSAFDNELIVPATKVFGEDAKWVYVSELAYNQVEEERPEQATIDKFSDFMQENTDSIYYKETEIDDKNFLLEWRSIKLLMNGASAQLYGEYYNLNGYCLTEKDFEFLMAATDDMLNNTDFMNRYDNGEYTIDMIKELGAMLLK